MQESTSIPVIQKTSQKFVVKKNDDTVKESVIR